MKKKLNFIIDTNKSSDAVINDKILSEFGEEALNQETVIFGENGIKLAQKFNVEVVSARVLYAGINLVSGVIVDENNEGFACSIDEEEYGTGNDHIIVKNENDEDITDTIDVLVWHLPMEFVEGENKKLYMQDKCFYDPDGGETDVTQIDLQNKIIFFFKDLEKKFVNVSVNHGEFMGDVILAAVDTRMVDDEPTIIYHVKSKGIYVKVTQDGALQGSSIDAINEEINEEDIQEYDVIGEASYIIFPKLDDNDVPLNKTVKYEVETLENGAVLVEIDDFYSDYVPDTLLNQDGFIVGGDEELPKLLIKKVSGGISKEVIDLINGNIEDTNSKIEDTNSKINTVSKRVEEVANSIPTVPATEEIANSIISNETLLASLSSAVMEKINVSLIAKNGDEITSNLVYDEDKKAYILDYDTSLLDGTDYTIELKLV